MSTRPSPRGVPPTAEARALVAAVPDPELPFLTIADLGILRDVCVDGTSVRVQITPTYSGCPALDSIREDVLQALRDGGFTDATVETVLTPAWTTDWLSDAARAALAEHGIAPPGPARGPVRLGFPVRTGPSGPSEVARDRGHVPSIAGDLLDGMAGPERSGAPGAAFTGGGVGCPQCGSRDTEELARFGSTACKALWRCRACREPFEQFKDY